MTSASPLPHRFAFRLLRREDLPLLTRWRGAEHVSRWWGEPGDLAAEYFSHGEPVRYHLALLEDQPAGVIEHYHWADHAAEAEPIGAAPDEDGVDYFLGEEELMGHGLGGVMLTAFIAEQVFADPGVRGVRVDVAEANRRSWRCLEKLGFRRTRAGVSVAGEPGPHYVYALPRP